MQATTAASTLEVLGYKSPQQHSGAEAWAAILSGHDLAVAAPATVQAELALLPALARVAEVPSLNLLAMTPSASAAGRLEARMACWAARLGVELACPQHQAALCSRMDPATTGNINRAPTLAALGLAPWPPGPVVASQRSAGRCVATWPTAFIVAATRHSGSDAEHVDPGDAELLLLLAWGEPLVEPQISALRAALRHLPPPQQIVMVAEAWTTAAQSFASELLTAPEVLGLPAEGPLSSRAPVLKSLPSQLELVPAARGPGSLAAAAASKSPALSKDSMVAKSSGHSRSESASHQSVPELELAFADLAERISHVADEDDCEEDCECAQQAEEEGEENETVSEGDGSSEVGAGELKQGQAPEDMQLLGKYIANIVCRSQNLDFREAVIALLPKSRKRKAPNTLPISKARSSTGAAAGVGAPSTAEGTPEEEEEAMIRQGIAMLLARHHLATQCPAAKAKGSGAQKPLSQASGPRTAKAAAKKRPQARPQAERSNAAPARRTSASSVWSSSDESSEAEARLPSEGRQREHDRPLTRAASAECMAGPLLPGTTVSTMRCRGS